MGSGALDSALDTFRRRGSYLTVSLADSADSGWARGVWAAGTLARKFVTFAERGLAGDYDYSPPMVYTVWALEASGNQVTAVILRNP